MKATVLQRLASSRLPRQQAERPSILTTTRSSSCRIDSSPDWELYARSATDTVRGGPTNRTLPNKYTHLPDMELGHILWPSDPVSRESSDPETQLTRWPCSIMNSKMSTYVADKRLQWARGLPVLSLFGVCTLLKSKILKIIIKC